MALLSICLFWFLRAVEKKKLQYSFQLVVFAVIYQSQRSLPLVKMKRELLKLYNRRRRQPSHELLPKDSKIWTWTKKTRPLSYSEHECVESRDISERYYYFIFLFHWELCSSILPSSLLFLLSARRDVICVHGLWCCFRPRSRATLKRYVASARGE